MLRNASLSMLLAATAALATARPAAAAFTVAASGATTIVTQTDANALIVTRMPSGDLIVSSSGPLEAFPPSTNLVVRGFDGAPSSLFVVLDSPLPGSLTLELRGETSATLRGTAASIGNALKVQGDAAVQHLTFSNVDGPIAIRRTASIDLGEGADRMDFGDGSTIGGALKLEGANDVRGSGLRVDRSTSIDVKRDVVDTDVVLPDLVVGRSFTMLGGAGRSYLSLHGGSVGRSVKLTYGDSVNHIYVFLDAIGGSLTASYGSNNNIFALGQNAVVQGSVNLSMPGPGESLVEFDGTVRGKAIRYRGGAGNDEFNLRSVSPRAMATFDLGGGDDEFTIYADRVQLKRLTLDLGEGTDELDDNGWVPPPGSTITGLP